MCVRVCACVCECMCLWGGVGGGGAYGGIAGGRRSFTARFECPTPQQNMFVAPRLFVEQLCGRLPWTQRKPNCRHCGGMHEASVRLGHLCPRPTPCPCSACVVGIERVFVWAWRCAWMCVGVCGWVWGGGDVGWQECYSGRRRAHDDGGDRGRPAGREAPSHHRCATRASTCTIQCGPTVVSWPCLCPLPIGVG